MDLSEITGRLGYMYPYIEGIFHGILCIDAIILVSICAFQINLFAPINIIFIKIIEMINKYLKWQIIIASVFLIPVTIFLATIILLYISQGNDNLEDTYVNEVKDRYAKYIYYRLIADVHEAQTRYVERLQEVDNINLISIQRIDAIRNAIERFREDAGRLLTTNRQEILQYPHHIYIMNENDARLQPLYRQNIEANTQLVTTLYNIR